MTAYLRNYWYLAAWTRELEDGPIGRKLFDIPLVIFRTDSGRIAILDNVCPHRFSALHPGRVLGEAIECPYHGLRFDAEGACVHSPFSATPPNVQRLRSHPVVEQDGFVWFWYGDPALAADHPAPDHSSVRQTETTELIYLHNYMKADFMLGIDNLMEQSHVGFLHRNTFGQGTDMLADYFRQGRHRTFDSDGAIVSHWQFSDDPADYVQTRWLAPSTCVIEKGRDHAIPPNARKMIGLHLYTPETATSSHYFAVEAYDTRYDPPEYGPMITDLVTRAFQDEDVAAIERIQQNMGGADLFDLNPLLLSIDAGAVQARRAYRRLLERQADAAAPARESANA